LLSHPNGAALAAFAHVERSEHMPSAGKPPLEEYTVFLETLRRIMLGYTAGAAKNSSTNGMPYSSLSSVSA